MAIGDDLIAGIALVDVVELVAVINHVRLGRRRRGDSVPRPGWGDHTNTCVVISPHSRAILPDLRVLFRKVFL